MRLMETEPVPVQERPERGPESTLKVIVVGAGLGGLGAAISILLAGHDVTVLEAAPRVVEAGAGIQILPNAARVLQSWGLAGQLENVATRPRKCNFFGWRGNKVGEMDYHKFAQTAGGLPFMDFHRADLHARLLDRARELGATVFLGSWVRKFTVSADGDKGNVLLADGRIMTADLIVGADGTHSTLRRELLGRPDPPVVTGQVAYRLLLDARQMLQDPDLRPMIEEPQVNHWVGPDKHAVGYAVRDGKLFTMFLVVPEDQSTGTVGKGDDKGKEMRGLFGNWDTRVDKILALSQAGSILKWSLCFRPVLDPAWSHPSGVLTMLGDAVHATLPYLSSGAGMALEDAGVLGLCLGRLVDKSPASKTQALAAYEACRRDRIEKVVQWSSHYQRLFHLPDGPEQVARDENFRLFGELEKDRLGSEPRHPSAQQDYIMPGEDPLPWRQYGVGQWLLNYCMFRDVDARWRSREGIETEIRSRE